MLWEVNVSYFSINHIEQLENREVLLARAERGAVLVRGQESKETTNRNILRYIKIILTECNNYVPKV